MSRVRCEKCGIEYGIGDFPFCKGGHGRPNYTAIQDSIEGGVLIEHGLCNDDGTPRRYYSKSEIAAEAKRRGLVNQVRHIDGSPYTSRWI